jgi:hypothetical protein
MVVPVLVVFGTFAPAASIFSFLINERNLVQFSKENPPFGTVVTM